MPESREIIFRVELDGDRVPSQISWHASDSPYQEAQPCKSMMVSLWDSKEKNTLSIDLWTKDMPVQEMRVFTAQVLEKLGDTFERATRNQQLGAMIRTFAGDFKSKLKEVEKQEREMQNNS